MVFPAYIMPLPGGANKDASGLYHFKRISTGAKKQNTLAGL